MLKRLVFPGLVLSLLVLIFRLTTTSAAPSPTDCVEAVTFSNNRILVVINGVLHERTMTGPSDVFPPLPPGSAVAGIHVDFVGHLWVLFRNGRLYQYGPSGTWELVQDMGCEVTAVEPSTWGQIKHQAGK
jgi:hypothetical protein